jgi:hypothetical protein
VRRSRAEKRERESTEIVSVCKCISVYKCMCCVCCVCVCCVHVRRWLCEGGQARYVLKGIKRLGHGHVVCHIQVTSLVSQENSAHNRFSPSPLAFPSQSPRARSNSCVCLARGLRAAPSTTFPRGPPLVRPPYDQGPQGLPFTPPPSCQGPEWAALGPTPLLPMALGGYP